MWSTQIILSPKKHAERLLYKHTFRRVIMDIIIRNIEEKDYIEVAELLFNDLWNRKINTDNVVPFFNKVKNDESYIAFVAVLANNVIGYISAIMFIGCLV
jgi:hypothetical protein